jgi:hypothetical protein
MTDTASEIRLRNARRLAPALIVAALLFCGAAAYGAFHFVSLFEQEKEAQKSHQENLQAVMLVQSSVIDLQGYVLGGDTRLTGRLSDKASQFEALQRDHSKDHDFQRLNDAFHMWHQTLAEPMIQKRHEFDTSSLNFSQMGISYIQGNAPLHERRLEDISTQALNASKENLEAAQSRIAGFLMPAVTVIAALGAATLLLAFLLLRNIRA